MSDKNRLIIILSISSLSSVRCELIYLPYKSNSLLSHVQFSDAINFANEAANSVDPNQTTPQEQSDLGLHFLHQPVCPNTYNIDIFLYIVKADGDCNVGQVDDDICPLNAACTDNKCKCKTGYETDDTTSLCKATNGKWG